MESKKYNNIKILLKNKKNILRRFEKEFGENKKFKHYDNLSEEIQRKLFSFVITDIIELICYSFKENGIYITKEDYFEQIRKSRGKAIFNEEDLIKFFPYISTSFEKFMRQPIMHNLCWYDTTYGWTKCSLANNTYSKVIYRLSNEQI